MRLWTWLKSIFSSGPAPVFLPDSPAQPAGVPNFVKGRAKDILNEASVQSHLLATNHFGVLEPPRAKYPSRMDYVLLQCDLLLQLKEAYPACGLGSKFTFAGQTTSGLELCQVWAILGSWGHLWGTFSTERALVFQLHEENRIGELLSVLRTTTAAELIDDGSQSYLSMYHMHEYLALLRLDDAGFALDRREWLDAVWLAYVRRSPEVRRLLRVYRFARKVAFARFHEDVGISVAPVVSNLTYWERTGPWGEGVLRGFGDSKGLRVYDSATPFERLLDAIAEYEYETFFSSAYAASAVLAHMREFKVWWKSKPALSLREKIAALREQPSDWPTEAVANRQLILFARLPYLVPEMEWPSVVSDWWAHGKPWGEANFYITLRPRTDHALLDLFVPESEPLPPPSALHHVLVRIWKWGWPPGEPGEQRRKLRDRAIVGLLVACVNARLNPDYHKEVETIDGSPPAAFYVWDAQGRHRAKDSIASLPDEQRKRELELFLGTIEQHKLIPTDARVVWLQGPGYILDRDDEKQTDLDGCALVVTPTASYLLLAECKHTKRGPGMGSQVERWRELFRAHVQIVHQNTRGKQAGSITVARVA